MKLLDRMVSLAREHNMPLYAISVWQDGELSTERINHGNAANHIYSVSKNFSATAAGILIDRGLLSLDDTVYDIFHADYPDMPEAWKACKLRHVMTQTPGVLIPGFLDIDADDVRTYGDDYLGYTLAHAPTVTPGTEFCYTDSNFYLVSRVVSKITGERMQDFLQRELFLPLCFQNHAWMTDNVGYAIGGTGLVVRVEDMIKFGLLYMQNGVWEGKRILSENWCKIATTNYVDMDGENGYGYSFRMLASQPTAFFCSGAFGQVIRCYRDINTVVAWQGFDEERVNLPLERFCDAVAKGQA